LERKKASVSHPSDSHIRALKHPVEEEGKKGGSTSVLYFFFIKIKPSKKAIQNRFKETKSLENALH
jgi:hypothetical protein